MTGRRGVLVLTRKIGDKTIINGELEITVVSVKGNRVQLGFFETGDTQFDVERPEAKDRLSKREGA